jgi:hypothetical protein
MQSVGFKEWALVCEALGRGEQTILLRKGGIAEGREGFGFRHAEFFLFPTFFHEQMEKVRTPSAAVLAPAQGTIQIRYFAKLEAQTKITSWPAAVRLQPFHILDESVVRERFEYKGAGLHVALVRVYHMEPEWALADESRYGGCRSWVELPECPPTTRFEPVLGDKEHANVADRFNAFCSRDR